VLAKAFRGELVPTEAELARREKRTYEPAADLLARIRAEREQPAPPANGKPKRTRKPTAADPSPLEAPTERVRAAVEGAAGDEAA